MQPHLIAVRLSKGTKLNNVWLNPVMSARLLWQDQDQDQDLMSKTKTKTKTKTLRFCSNKTKTKTKVPRPRLHNPSQDQDIICTIPSKIRFWPDMSLYELKDTRTKKWTCFFGPILPKIINIEYFQYTSSQNYSWQKSYLNEWFVAFAIAVIIYACRECWSCYSYVLLLREFYFIVQTYKSYSI